VGREAELVGIESNDPRRLANLLAVHPTPVSEREIEELGDLLRRHLATPLGDYLPDNTAKLVDALEQRESLSVGSVITLADLFRLPAPPLRVLEAVRRRARRGLRADSGGIPADVYGVVYFTSIAAAMAGHGKKISKSSDETLRAGFERFAEEPWVEQWLRTMFRTSLECLDRIAN
jgi:hypothetical protein